MNRTCGSSYSLKCNRIYLHFDRKLLPKEDGVILKNLISYLVKVEGLGRWSTEMAANLVKNENYN